jgi:MYND finger
MSTISSISKKDLITKYCAFDPTHKPDKVSTCGRCKVAKYCNTGCQKKDWHVHKEVCKLPAPKFRIVLQGEMAIVKAKNATDGLIKTTRPFNCIVFTLYDQTNHIGILAHIDSHTGVAKSILEIGKKLKEKMNVPLSSNFTASVMGGTDRDFSVNQKNLIITYLKSMMVTIKMFDFGKEKTEPPQIIFNAYSGELSFIHKKDSCFNYSLQYLQFREFAIFGFSSESETGNFRIKEATRMETDVPRFNVKLDRDGNMDHKFFRSQEEKMPLCLQPKRPF